MKKQVLMLVLILFSISLISAKSIEIDLDKQSVVPGELISFKISLYQGSEKVDGMINYNIYDTYEELIKSGTANSGEEISFIPDKNALNGYWTIIAKSGEIEANRLFNVDELEEASLILEGDNLIIKNIGNTEYNKQLLITIGDKEELIEVLLGIGQEKRLKLVAPDGNYDVRISDGEETVQKSGVSLTGNVIGIETIDNSGFIGRYPLVMIFIILLIGMFVIVSFVKVKKKLSK
jgi:hypothetical protein